MPLDLKALLSAGVTAEAMSLLGTGERLFALDVNRLGAGSAARADAPAVEVPKAVGLLRLQGSLTPPVMSAFRDRLAAARDNPDLGALIIEVDSPGGTVAGTPETGDAVAAAASVKPTVAWINTLGASAAYWIPAQASQIWMTPSGEVGSIGVRALHADISKMLSDTGINMTEISAGKYKTEGSPFAPLSEGARAHMDARAEAAHGDFVNAVAKGRRVTVDRVRADFGQGRTFGAQDAVRLGMADRIGTLSDVVASLHTQKGTVRRRTALAFA